MVLYAQAVEEVAPRWWAWPPLGFVPAAEVTLTRTLTLTLTLT
jgi:hypothetical protein